MWYKFWIYHQWKIMTNLLRWFTSEIIDNILQTNATSVPIFVGKQSAQTMPNSEMLPAKKNMCWQLLAYFSCLNSILKNNSWQNSMFCGGIKHTSNPFTPTSKTIFSPIKNPHLEGMSQPAMFDDTGHINFTISQ